MRKFVMALSGLALVVSGCATQGSPVSAKPVAEVSTASSPPSSDFLIQIRIAGTNFDVNPDGSCKGNLFIAELRKGSYVTITDAKGVIIGTSNLDLGKHEDGECVFYTRPKVQRGSDFYTIQVGTMTPVTRSAADAHSQGVGIGYGF